MGLLSGPAIEKEISEGRIKIDPFDPLCVGPNSVDLHLGHTMSTFPKEWAGSGYYLDGDRVHRVIDPEEPPPLEDVGLWDGSGWFLLPGNLYLGTTLERTYCEGYVPRIAGRSSFARLGVSFHQTAGEGDDGFEGQWTLEITVARPVILRPEMRCLQIYFTPVIGERRPYGVHGRYQDQADVTGSRYHLDRDHHHGEKVLETVEVYVNCARCGYVKPGRLESRRCPDCYEESLMEVRG